MGMSPRLLRPRATGFNPKSISGLKLWLDVANRSSLTFNGSAVSQVNDLSGNGFHATQDTGNNQPAYQATGANGKPTLYFNTSSIITTGASVADYILTPTTSPKFYVTMVVFMPSAGSGGDIEFGSDNQANGRVYFYLFYAGSSPIFDVAGVSGGRLLPGVVATDTQFSSPVVLTAYRNGSAMGIRRNGAELASISNASAVFSTTTAKLRFPESTGHAMYLSEAVVYAAGLSSGDLAKVERGLGKKWGITVA